MDAEDTDRRKSRSSRDFNNIHERLFKEKTEKDDRMKELQQKAEYERLKQQPFNPSVNKKNPAFKSKP